MKLRAGSLKRLGKKIKKKQTNFYPDPSRKKKKEQAQIDKIKNEKETLQLTPWKYKGS